MNANASNSFDGALRWAKSRSEKLYQEASTATNNEKYDVEFDASQSNSIYGGSTTVQPNAYVTYMWKRTK